MLHFTQTVFYLCSGAVRDYLCVVFVHKDWSALILLVYIVMCVFRPQSNRYSQIHKEHFTQSLN